MRFVDYIRCYVSCVLFAFQFLFLSFGFNVNVSGFEHLQERMTQKNGSPPLPHYFRKAILSFRSQCRAYLKIYCVVTTDQSGASLKKKKAA